MCLRDSLTTAQVIKMRIHAHIQSRQIHKMTHHVRLRNLRQWQRFRGQKLGANLRNPRNLRNVRFRKDLRATPRTGHLKQQFCGRRISHDPARVWELVAAITVMAGLLVSQVVRRRRMWSRITPDGTGTVRVELGGLARTDNSGWGGEFDSLTRRVAEADRR